MATISAVYAQARMPNCFAGDQFPSGTPMWHVSPFHMAHAYDLLMKNVKAAEEAVRNPVKQFAEQMEKVIGIANQELDKSNHEHANSHH